MEFFNIILTFASVAVTGFGAAIALGGIINLGEGKQQQSAAKTDEGISKIVGGGVIMVVGVVLVPQLSSLLTSVA